MEPEAVNMTLARGGQGSLGVAQLSTGGELSSLRVYVSVFNLYDIHTIGNRTHKVQCCYIEAFF